MRKMQKWRVCRKLLARGMQLAVLITAGAAWLIMPGVLAGCRSLAEGAIVLGVILGLSVCAGATGWLAVEYDDRTNREWREYKRRLARCRGLR